MLIFPPGLESDEKSGIERGLEVDINTESADLIIGVLIRLLLP